MGVNGLLPALASITHTVYFSSNSRNGIAVPNRRNDDGVNDEATNISGEGMDPTETQTTTMERAQKRNDGNNTNRNRKRSRKAIDTKLRVGIDASVWIARACHGHGAALLDERHLTNYGRAQLLQNQDHNHDRDSHSHSSAAAERTREFLVGALDYVIRNIRAVKEMCRAEVLVVLDGGAPPAKHLCRRDREISRRDAAVVRDEVVLLGLVGEDEHGEKDGEKEREQERVDRSKIQSAKRAGLSSSTYNSQHSLTHHTLTYLLLQRLKEDRIPFLVSPYEADGQLAYLSKRGLIDLILSEDGDLVGYGVETVLYKFQHRRAGFASPSQPEFAKGNLYRKCDLGATGTIHAAPKSFSLLDFSDTMLATWMVCAGCDYCPSLKGIGIKKAHYVVKMAFHGSFPSEDLRYSKFNKRKRSASKNSSPLLRRALDMLYHEAYGDIPQPARDQYEQSFLKALIMYRHPVVFDPILGNCIIYNIATPDPEFMDYEPYAKLITDRHFLQTNIVGRVYSSDVSVYVAEGWINPKTWRLWSDYTVSVNANPNTHLHTDENDCISSDDYSTTPNSVVEALQKEKIRLNLFLNKGMCYVDDGDEVAEVENTGTDEMTQHDKRLDDGATTIHSPTRPEQAQQQQQQQQQVLIPSQASSGISSASKLSSQPNSQKSGTSSDYSPDVKSPNLLPSPNSPFSTHATANPPIVSHDVSND